MSNDAQHNPEYGDQLIVKMSSEQKREIRIMAAKRGLNMSEFVRQLIAELQDKEDSEHRVAA